MALVDYPSSDESDEEASNSTLARKTLLVVKGKALKRKRSSPDSELPPLPDSFHDLYASTVRVGTHDDPALHGGRKRIIPHVEGNWPSHIYIEWYPSRTESTKLSTLISNVSKHASEKLDQIHTFLESELGAQLPLHISLSRSMMLLTDQRQPFVDLLEKFVNTSGIKPFDLAFKSLAWVPNFENTRWFLVLQLAKPAKDELNKLLQLCNRVANAFGQPTLYAAGPFTQPVKVSNLNGQNGPSKRGVRSSLENNGAMHAEDLSDKFHISIVWRLDPPALEAIEHLKSLDLESMQEIQVVVKAIKIKAGNTVHVFPLLEKLEK
ncbi:MAG: poly(U)-specific 3'-to-5' RNA exonuclease [Icmadophila ericetorum]|nr:poly(U)-specific 3'-to-5' RNA exonuclease [Icmadophila ericetorum]